MNIREEIIQKLYEMMCTESGVYDEVDELSDRLEEIACKDIDERSVEYDNVLNAICEYEHATFFAGASMVLDFITGKEVQ